jgi:alpha-galactosidase
VLCNAEVIEVDQDPLGRQAAMIKKTDKLFIMAKPMADGSTAVGLFNLEPEKQELSVSWKELGITGKKQVRDLWRQKGLGNFSDHFAAVVQPHGVSLIRIVSE